MSAVKTKVENIGSLAKKVIITLPRAEILKNKKTKIATYSKRIKLDGFRNGMVPAHVMEKRYGRQAVNDAISEMFDNTFQQALKEHNLKPVGNISFDEQPAAEEIVQDNDLRYVLSLEVYPTITVDKDDFSKINLEKPVFEITESDLEDGLRKLQEQFATWQQVDRAAKDGDEVTVDFVGEMHGKGFEGGTANDVKIIIGSKQFIEGFEAGLIGLSADDKKSLHLKFPAEYVVKEYSDKDVVFHVTVKAVAEKIPAELNESFAMRIGIADGAVDKIREKVKENMQQYADAAITDHLREKAADKLIETYTLDIPTSLIKEEKKHILADLNNVKNASEAEQLDDANIEKQAEDRVKVALIVNEIIVKNELTPDLSKVKQKVFELTYSGLTNDFFKKNPKQAKQIIERIKHNVVTEAAMDLIIAGATISEKKIKFSDIAEGSIFKNQ
jgi:trigger factor